MSKALHEAAWGWSDPVDQGFLRARCPELGMFGAVEINADVY